MGGGKMDWFRFYSEVLDDPKVQRLPGNLFKSWVNLLCLANKSRCRGVLPPLTDVAFALRLSEAAAKGLVRQLIDYGLIEVLGDGSLCPHNWDGRQHPSDDAAGRKREYRARLSQPTDPPPDPDTARDTSQPTARDINGTSPVPEEKREEEETETEEKRAEQSRGDETPPRPQRPRSVPKPAETLVPDDWPVTAYLADWWAEQAAPAAIDLDRETEKWQDYHRLKRTKVTDWAASWRNWMRKAIEYYQPPAPAGKQGRNGYAAPQRQPDSLTRKLNGTAELFADIDAGTLQGVDRPGSTNVSLLRSRAVS